MTDPWKTSLPLAVGLHFLMLAVAMILPSILERHPLLPEVYTVDLFTVTELTPPAPAPARLAPAKPKAIESPASPQKIPVETKTPASPVPTATPVSTAPAKVISLAPRKQKTKTRKEPDPTVKRAVEQRKLSKAFQELQTRIKEKEARKKLDRLTQDALGKIRAAYAGAAAETPVPSPVASAVDTGPKQVKATPTTTAGAGPADSGGGVTSDAVKQYYATVQGKIKAHWSLPDLQDWDTSLKAILVIKLRRDGVVTKTFFDQKSKNVQFNQFVLKAVREATPLPPFPSELKEYQIEIGLRFSMEELL